MDNFKLHRETAAGALRSRGFRNNNPLNIRHGLSRWVGRLPLQTDPAFVGFQSLAMGYRAAWKLLDSYRCRLAVQGRSFCLHNIIERWAPQADGNSPTAYLHAVLNLCGGSIGGWENLMPPTTPMGREQLQRVIAAMTCVENGIALAQVPWQAIDEGYELAFCDDGSTSQRA